MTTRALQIRDAITALLTASTCGGVPPERIHKDIAYALDAGAANLPSIVVELGHESAQRGALGRMDRTVQVTVTVLSGATKGVGEADAATNADAPLAEAYRRIVSDVTLGGLAFDVIDGGITRDRDELDKPVMLTRITYDVSYNTNDLSLEE